jgi:hypothetical protein
LICAVFNIKRTQQIAGALVTKNGINNINYIYRLFPELRVNLQSSPNTDTQADIQANIQSASPATPATVKTTSTVAPTASAPAPAAAVKTKRVASKATAPVAKPAPAGKAPAAKTPATKATTAAAPKAPVKAAATSVKSVKKAAPKVAEKANASATSTSVAEKKPAKEKKIKMVRDSISIPKAEYSALDSMKLRAGKLGLPVKKTELIRAGIKALAALSDAAFGNAIKAVPSLKTGRPSKAK